MSRGFLVFIALLSITGLQFKYYPGHSYLGASTQLFVPMLEHLQKPAYLTRDLVATHPQFAHTVYDELTLLLLRSGQFDLKHALLWQLVLSRLAEVGGVFLLARAAGAGRWFALLLSALINFGTFLPGVNVWLTDTEPTPRTFAFGFSLLALGLLAKTHPLQAALCAGISFLYDPVTALPFWVLAATVAIFNRDARRSLRRLIPVCLVFILLLANLAQLQPGTPDSQALSERVSDEIAHIQQFRSPELWISKWPRGVVYLYLAIWVTTIWAVTRLLPLLPRVSRWLLLVIPSFATGTLLLSFVLLDRLHWAFVLRSRPLEWCAFTVVLAFVVFAMAASKAVQAKAYGEAAAWLVACLCVFLMVRSRPPLSTPQRGEVQLADWAANNTWGSSMFVFPDSQRALYPGVFRASSLRALWVDWESGREINNTVALAPVWRQRWQQTMTGLLDGDRLQQMLALPIDYYVFRTEHRVESSFEGKVTPVPAVYTNSDFRVFEANTLRLVPGRLVFATANGRSSAAADQLPR